MLLLGTGAIIVSESYEIPLRAREVGGNRPVNAAAADAADISSHNSPTLVRNPEDGANIAISNRIDSPRFSCALHVSFDGGRSFSQTPLPVPKGEEPKCYVPDVAFDADGTLYLSFVTLAGGGNLPHAVWLSTSEDGGRTLSTPSKLLGPLSFQVRLVAHPEKAGRLYLTWVDAAATGLYRFVEPGRNPIRFTTSDDGGKSWREPVVVNEASRQRVLAPSLALGPDDELYVLYLDLGQDRLDYEGAHQGQGGGPPYPGFFELVLARSTDGGATWGENVIDDRVAPIERFIVFIPAFPSLAVDPASGAIYASFHDRSLGDADVYVWASEDGGVNWRRTRVNDTARRDGTSQYLPKIAVAPDGRLDVVYYDRRIDEENVQTEASLQSSVDRGESFIPRVRLSDQPFDSRIGWGSDRDMPELGSRLGLVSTDAGALAVWTDTRAGTRASSKQDLASQLVAFSEHRELSELVQYALRYGGAALGLAGLFLLVSWLITARTKTEPAEVA